MVATANPTAGDGGVRQVIRSNNLPTSNNQSPVGVQAPLSREYVLAALRTAISRARLIVNQTTTIGIALKSEMISAEAALLWAQDAGVLELVGNEDIEAAALRASTCSQTGGCGGDAAGDAAARDCALRWKQQGRHVRIARPPSGKDFADLLVGRVPRIEEGIA